MGHTGNYTREEAIAAIDKEGTLPDVLSFDPSKPAKYPNGRVFTDDVIDYRLAFLTKNEVSSLGPQASHRRPQGVSISRDAAFEIAKYTGTGAMLWPTALTSAFGTWRTFRSSAFGC